MPLSHIVDARIPSLPSKRGLSRVMLEEMEEAPVNRMRHLSFEKTPNGAILAWRVFGLGATAKR